MNAVTTLSRVSPVKTGTKSKVYNLYLMPEEEIELEFNGGGSILALSQHRVILCQTRGGKLAVTSMKWSSITAFSIESTGMLKKGSALRLWGSGFGCTEVIFQHQADLTSLNRFICEKVYLN